MSYTEEMGRDDRGRVLGFVARAAAVLALVAAVACSSGKSKATQASADVGFLVDSCAKAGLSAEVCRCVGNAAKKQLSADLLQKMRTAPPDDDVAALEKYYSRADVQTVMTFLDQAAASCGVRQAD